MELDHTFSVPTDVETTWAHFEDIASVAECFPGATVTAVDGPTFQGTCKVKLGPIALVYGGSGTFTEKDEAAHRFVVEAKGKDKRGNGTAGATVTLAMASAPSGGTDVSVHTDLAITGKPAQFGRGVMQDVSDKLLGQFVACLEQRLGGSDVASVAEPPTAAEATTADDAPAPAPAASVPPPMAAAAPREAGRRAQPGYDGAADPGEDVLEAGPGRARPDRAGGLVAGELTVGARGPDVVIRCGWTSRRPPRSRCHRAEQREAEQHVAHGDPAQVSTLPVAPVPLLRDAVATIVSGGDERRTAVEALAVVLSADLREAEEQSRQHQHRADCRCSDDQSRTTTHASQHPIDGVPAIGSRP